MCVVCFGVLCICIDDYMHELYIPDLRRVGVTSRDSYIIRLVNITRQINTNYLCEMLP